MSFLAGCRAVGPQPTPTSTSHPTDTPRPTPTPRPTDTPRPQPTATSVPTPITQVRRSEIIQFHPDAPSKVVQAHHAGVWTGAPQGGAGDNNLLNSEAIHQMLDASITELTGLNDAAEAWAALFAPDERIAIKVNAIQGSVFWTHVPLVMAVTECLQEAGVPAEQIIIFDREPFELENAGYTINQDGPGVRCYGTESYTGGWSIMDTNVRLSDILLSCHALINMPILKRHPEAGITFAMKNHYGTFDRPRSFHGPGIGPGISELNALAPIRDRTRLVIGDALTICPVAWVQGVIGDSILVSFDPVAHDTVGLETLCEHIDSEGGNAAAATDISNTWLIPAAELGVGANNPDDMDLVEINL